MTILPKKKNASQQANPEKDPNEAGNVSLGLHQQLPANLSNHIQAVGSPGPQERGPLSPAPYEDERPAPTGSPLPPSVGCKRRVFRGSPLRSVRPKLRDHRVVGGASSPPYTPHTTLPSPPHPPSPSPQAGPSSSEEEAPRQGYNSDDEHRHPGWRVAISEQEWLEKERWFEKKMKKKGLLIKQMGDDGACLFRSIADQVYGDQDMHDIVRKNCMDYIETNEDTYMQFVSEDFASYVARKRRLDEFGNHIEIAAMSELYNRVIELYCYSVEPINIFQSGLATDNPCIRLSYHRGTHYNSLHDPCKPTYGVGLGLPGLVPGLADDNLMKEATSQSENLHIEQAMLEDKLRATDDEALAEAIERQVAAESYLDYLRECDRRGGQKRVGCTSSSSQQDKGASCSSRPSPRPSPPLPTRPSSRNSPPHHASSRVSPRNSPPHPFSRSSPRASPPHPSRSPRASPPHRSPPPSTSTAVAGSSKDPPPPSTIASDWDFALNESASFLGDVPAELFGLSDFSSAESKMLAQAMAESQQEYLDALKRGAET